MPEHYEPVESPIDTKPTSSKCRQIQLYASIKEDREFIGSNKDYPFVATTYRLIRAFPQLDWQ